MRRLAMLSLLAVGMLSVTGCALFNRCGDACASKSKCAPCEAACAQWKEVTEKVPVTTYQKVVEKEEYTVMTRVEKEVPVKMTRIVEKKVPQTVKKTVTKCVPEQSTKTVERWAWRRVPVESPGPCDPCANACAPRTRLCRVKLSEEVPCTVYKQVEEEVEVTEYKITREEVPYETTKTVVQCVPETRTRDVVKCVPVTTYKEVTRKVCIREAALLLEVADVNDPVQVGDNEEYVIKVTNQGSKTVEDVRIVAEMEDVMELVRSWGQTNPNDQQKHKVEFLPVEHLGPGQSATWRVTGKALKPSDSRFRVVMTSRDLGRPVEETEATRLFN